MEREATEEHGLPTAMANFEFDPLVAPTYLKSPLSRPSGLHASPSR
jgi:hypothetical protein